MSDTNAILREETFRPDRLLCLLALAAAASFAYGPRVILLCTAGALSALAGEMLCLYLRHIPFRLRNLDAGAEGLILTMLFPPTVPYPLVICSALFAVIVARGLFGGKENPVIPPAAAGYCFALLNRPEQVTGFPAQVGTLPVILRDPPPLTDGLSQVWMNTGKCPVTSNQLLGCAPGVPVGSCCAVLLIAVAVLLVLRGGASAWTTLPVAAMYIGFQTAVLRMQDPVFASAAACLNGQMLFVAVFLFGEPHHAPPHVAGALFGMLCAGLTILMQTGLHIPDAPVLLAVLTAPVAVFLRHLFENTEEENGENDEHSGQQAGDTESAEPENISG